MAVMVDGFHLLSKLPIDVAAMAHPQDEDRAGAVVYAIHDPMVADADPEHVGTGQLLRPCGPGVAAEAPDPSFDAVEQHGRETLEIAFSGELSLNLIRGHAF